MVWMGYCALSMARGLQPYNPVLPSGLPAKPSTPLSLPFLLQFSIDLQIWMLTGDKSETAVNIGFATQMLTNDMDLLLLTMEALGSPGG